MIRVDNEIGRLRKVIVHQPGAELLAVTPANRSEFLYDDLIDLNGAAKEHRRFTSVLERFAEVLTVGDLLRETLENPEAREFLICRSEEVTSDHSLRDRLSACTPNQLVDYFIAGWQLAPGPFSAQLNTESYILPPLPNLFFTRDAAMVLGDAAVISAMRFVARWPEEVLMRTLFGFHPALMNEGKSSILYDGSDERRHNYMLEGGDIHPLSPEVVLLGLSERTSAASVDELCSTLFEQTSFTDVIAVVLPEKTTAIHLDMVWTSLDRELCIAHPPIFRGPTRAPVLHRRKGEHIVRQPHDLFTALKEAGIAMDPVWAGGDNAPQQQREQWASGCNFLAVAPGQVLSYARNVGTLRNLEGAGFKVIDGDEFLLGKTKLSDSQRAVITFQGAELVRGGGGPRCMTCPVLRDAL